MSERPGWKSMRLKHAAPIRVTRLDAKPNVSDYVALENIEPWSGKLLMDDPIEDVEGGVAVFERGDVLFGKLRPYLAKVARPAFSGVCSTELVVLRPRTVLPEYLQYYLLTPPFISDVNSWTFGTKMPRLSPERLLNAGISVPPKEEQRAIVRFLDEETAKIDTLVEKKLALRKLAKDQLRSEVAEAISSADIGIEKGLRLKQVAPFVTSGSRGWAEHYSIEGENFIRIGNLQGDSIDLDLRSVQKVLVPSGAEADRTVAKAGDVLVSITALIGAVGVVPTDFSGYVNQHVALCRPDHRLVHPRWLAYCLFSDLGQHQFASELYGGTKQGLGLDDVKNLRLPVPSLAIQNKLVDQLDRAMLSHVRFVEASCQAVRLLKEYRTALITAAVTGQIDVGRAA